MLAQLKIEVKYVFESSVNTAKASNFRDSHGDTEAFEMIVELLLHLGLGLFCRFENSMRTRILIECKTTI